jgi:hypothetical protein
MDNSRNGDAFVARARHFAEVEIRARPDLWSERTLTAMTIFILGNAGASVDEIVAWMRTTPDMVKREAGEMMAALSKGTPEANEAARRVADIGREMGDISPAATALPDELPDNVVRLPVGNFIREKVRSRRHV